MLALYTNSDFDTRTAVTVTAVAAIGHGIIPLTMHDVDNEYKSDTGTGKVVVLGTGTNYYTNVSDLIHCDTALVQLLTLTRKRQCR
jgi:hypothetical protein